MGLLSRLFGSGAGVDEIDVQSAATAFSDPSVQIVDCRSQREWKSGHIRGARLMPLDTIGSRAKDLDPARPVVVVCRSGHRSSIAARTLASHGFTDVKSLKGGLSAWTRAGHRLVS